MTTRDDTNLDSQAPKQFNIDDYGGVDDGTTDCSKAFEKAWTDAKHYGREHNDAATEVVFRRRKTGVFLMHPLVLSGGNNMGVSLGPDVTVSALRYCAKNNPYPGFNNIAIKFKDVHGLKIKGKSRETSVFQGNGPSWPGYTGDQSSGELTRPNLLVIDQCSQVLLDNFSILDSPCFNLIFDQCTHGEARYLNVICPSDSNNTDGIHLNDSHKCTVQNCLIHNGDDAIVVDAGTSRVSDQHTVRDLMIEYSHGVSIGSSIKGTVKDCHFYNISLRYATNGIRFKSRTTDTGKVEHCTYDQFTMHNVAMPLVIEIGTYGGKGGETAAGAQLKDITVKNLTATVDGQYLAGNDVHAGMIDIVSGAPPIEGFRIEHFYARNYPRWSFKAGGTTGFSTEYVYPPFSPSGQE